MFVYILLYLLMGLVVLDAIREGKTTSIQKGIIIVIFWPIILLIILILGLYFKSTKDSK
jgi:hypothetical protein